MAAPISAAPASRRPTISVLLLLLAASAFILATGNATFFSRAAIIFEGNPLGLTVFSAVGFSTILFSLALLAIPGLEKPVVAALLILASITAYYQDTLGATMDRDMIQNTFDSEWVQTKHLITADLLKHLFLTGILPALGVLLLRLRRPRTLWRKLGGWIGTTLGAFVLFLALLYSDFRTYSAVIHDHRDLHWSLQPGAPLAGTFSYAKMLLRARNVVLAPLGVDAQKGPRLKAAGKPVVTIVVAGETARAASFSLSGYARNTNPELSTRPIIYFSNVSSCGTATAVSLPCMFSNLTRGGYSYQAGISQENLMDVVMHAGVKVHWFDSDGGHLGVADRVPTTLLYQLDDPESCAKGECEDSIAFKPLRKMLAEATEDTVIILHQMGSHGPAYYLRYPPNFEPFAPACQSAAFGDCTPQEILNAYDNTIAYTDFFLASVIDMLAEQDNVITSLIYASDHGESLGEGGLYLHGAPYWLAPSEQTHIPMLMWFSESYKAAFSLDEACLRAKADAPLSHDNYFHTVLGMAGIETAVRQPALDITTGCIAP